MAGVPMSEIVGRRLDLGEFWGRTARELAEQVGVATDATEGLRTLAAGLRRRLDRIDEPAPDMQFVFRSLAGEPGMPVPSLGAIARELGLSERGLRRRCHDAFGYGGKTLDRILRFQRFVELARRPDAAGLPMLAAEAGYADQAHLTREVRRLCGFSPAAALRQLAG